MRGPRAVALPLLFLLLAAHSTAGGHSTAAGRGSTPVALQGSALLITYYSGVMDSLQQAGWAVPGFTPVYGLSGGAWTAVLSTLGYSGAAQRDAWKRWVAACRQRWGSCEGHIREVMQEAFEELLPADAAERVSGRVRVALAQLDSRQVHLNGSAPWAVSRFADKADLVSALAATSYIPAFSGPSPYTLFRCQPVIDGGFANGFQQLCPEGGCLKVASWLVGPRANHTCDPQRCGSFASASHCSAPERREPIPSALFLNEGPADEWALPPLARTAKHCSAAAEGVAATRAGAPAVHSALAASLVLPDFVPHNQTLPDIHPGKYGPLPQIDGREVLACEWQSWAMRLPAGRELEAMDLAFEQGRKDAAGWIAEHGGLQGARAPAWQGRSSGSSSASLQGGGPCRQCPPLGASSPAGSVDSHL